MPLRFTCPTPKPGMPKQINHLGDQVRARRVELGLTQGEAAAILGVTRETVNNWEMEHVRPAFRPYPAIHKFLEADPDQDPGSRDEAIRGKSIRRGWSTRQVDH